MNILRLFCLLCLSALLSRSLPAAQPRIVFHELVNPGPGKLIHTYGSYPAMSGDGRIVCYSVDRLDGHLDLFAINTDGTGQHPLGLMPHGRYHPAISHNGVLAALWSNWDLYTLTTASGAPVKVLTMSNPGSIASIAVNDDGTKVYFIIRADDTIFNSTTVLQGGVYEINPDGSGRRLVTSLNAMKALVGGDASAWAGGLAAEGLAISQNNRLVFTFQPVYATFMNQIMGVNADGTGLHIMGPQVNNPSSVTISRDGSRVAFDQYGPRDLHTVGWDNTGHVVQVVPGHGYDPLRLTGNGSHLALVDRLLRADGGGLRSLRSGTSGSILAVGSDAPYLQISADGRKICSVKNFGNTSTLVMLELDPDNLRGAPDITNTAMTPGFVVHNNGTQATATAQATYSGTPNSAFVFANLMLNGLPDPVFHAPVGTLFDDGTNGDAVGGNGLYTQNRFSFFYPASALGPRVVRFVTENTISGLRHATMVDHEPFFVLAAPPAGSAPAITNVTPNPVAVGGTITITGSNFGITRTGNVVTVGGYSCYVASANGAGTQLTAEVNGFLGNGNYPLVVSANGQSSAPFAFTIGTAPLVPDINVTPGTLAFGTVNIGQSADLTLTIQNTGTATLNVPALQFGSARYTAPGVTLPLNIVAGGSRQITVRFTPAAAGAANATLNVISSDLDETSVPVNLTGTGQMTGGGTPDINVTPQFGLEFGDVAVGQTKDLAFTVQNTGTGDLTVTGMTLSAAPGSQWFSRVSPALPFTVAAGGSAQVTVRCAPTAVRIEIGDFNLVSNDPDESPKNVEMSASGTAPVTPPPASAGISDSFNRGDSDPCNLGRADGIFGGSGSHYYVPIFPGSGARITAQRLVNVTQDYGGVMFSALGGCATNGGNIGRIYNIAVRLSVPTNGAQQITQAGPFFHGRPGIAYDGIIGGDNAGYWVQLHSTGEVKVKNLNTLLTVATSGVPAYFDPAASHQIEIAVQETSLQVALDGRHLWFTQDAQLVPVISTPATAGTDGGSAGVAFGCEPNRGLIGGQWADNLVVGPYRSLLTLPDQDNSQPPPAATLSDSFNRADATECLLGAANHALGGSGNHFYLPVFANGAILSGNTLRNPGLDYSGLQFTASANCTGRGENLGTTLNMAMKLLVPSGVGGGITEAGPYFGNRAAAVHDGILGGSSAGYWVRLHSDGSVTVKNCNSLLTVTSTGTPGNFVANAWHRFEIALSGSSLQVALDGRRVTFKEGGQQVTTLTLPASGGSPAGAAGIAFGCEQNRGQAGGQQADDIVLTAFRSLTSLPVQNNFTTPAPLVLTCPTPDTLRITWSQSGYEGYLLEISDDFASGWVPLLLPINTLGSQYIIEFDMTAESRFYRLVKP